MSANIESKTRMLMYENDDSDGIHKCKSDDLILNMLPNASRNNM